MGRACISGLQVSLSLWVLLPTSWGLITMEPEHQVVKEGQSVTFTCVVTEASPGGNVLLRLGTLNRCTIDMNGTIRRKEPGFTCERSGGDGTRYDLTILRANKSYVEDSNMDVDCQVGTEKSNRVRLDIEYSPHIKSFTVNGGSIEPVVQQGDNVTLRCDVGANPNASIVIRRGGSILSRKNIVTMTSVTCMNMATYYCDASNKIGSTTSKIQLFVLCEPTASNAASNTIYSDINGQVTLRISVLAYPFPVFSWYGPTGGEIRISNGTLHSDGSWTDSVFLRRVKKADVGDYLIRVQNDVGVRNFTITLILKEGISRTLLVGIIVGCVILGLFVIIFTCCVVNKLRRKRNPEKDKDVLSEMISLSEQTGDIYSQVHKPKKKLSASDITVLKDEEEPIKNGQGPKVGRDDDGLLYIGVDVEDEPETDVIKGSEGDPTQYAEVEINTANLRNQKDSDVVQ